LDVVYYAELPFPPHMYAISSSVIENI